MTIHIIHKALSTAIITALTAASLTSCLDNDSSYHGFSSISMSAAYANPTSGYLAFAALGSWKITQSSNTDWYTLGMYEGSGGYFYTILATYEGNTTGTYRTAQVRIQDDGDSDTYFTTTIVQNGTRGDGSLGSAPNVSAISGDDGSEMTFSYDDNWRPTAFTMTINGVLKHSITLSYNETDSIITAKTTAADDLTGYYNAGWIPRDFLTSETDTVGYYNSGTIVSSGVVIRVEDHKASGEQYGASLLYYDQSFAADDERVADSLKFYHQYDPDDDKETFYEALRCSYSSVSNRNQSIDANQLLFGAEEVNPYVMLGLFRNMRCSYILDTAKGSNGSYSITTETNSDGSIATMAVTNPDEQVVTYTFTY